MYDKNNSYWSNSNRAPIEKVGNMKAKHGLLEERKEQKTVVAERNYTTESAAVDKQKDIDILSLLDHSTLAKIKRDFNSHAQPLSLEEFVDVMTKYLPVRELGEVRLASNLCKFFDDVDVSGDGSIEWDEFTGFIIDKGMGSVHVENDNGENSVHTYGKSAVVDKLRHDGCIDKVHYFPEMDHMVVLSKCKVVSAKDCSPISTLVGHKHEILCAEYMPSHNWLTTCANDRTIRFWDVGNDYTPVKFVINNDVSALVLRWFNREEILFTADSNGGINALKFHQNVSFSKELYTSQQVASFTGHHTDVVLDLLLLENMGSLASASMDSTIGLWDMNTQQAHHTLSGHTKGVLGMSYHANYHALISCAYEHHALVWNPYSGGMICQLKGHFNPLIGVQAVPQSPQIITADSGGVVKIWDIRTYTCVQTVYAEDARGHRINDVVSIASIPNHKRVLVAGRRLHFYDSMKEIEAVP